jgi:hypothetical protein
MARKKAGPKRVTVLVRDVPFDMMRYDHACPATEQDAGKLERISHRTTRRDTDPMTADDRTITFICYAYSAPTVGRWESFGCRIVKVEEA